MSFFLILLRIIFVVTSLLVCFQYIQFLNGSRHRDIANLRGKSDQEKIHEFAKYPETSIFNETFYLEGNRDAAIYEREFGLSAEAHWISHGIQEGKRFHTGKRILKLVLMTMNEWPLLKSWILYHGSIFGFENLYILDSSTDKNCTSFLNRVENVFGVHVFFSNGNLNTATDELTLIFNGIRKSSDFVIKMDTDEFLGIYNHDTKRFSMTGILDHIDILPYDGHTYKIGWTAVNSINESCHTTDDVSMTSLLFHPLGPTKFKTFFAAWTFQELDLGGHAGRVKEPYASDIHHDTDLAIYHFHYQCLEQYISNHRKVIIQHQYMLADDSVEVQLEKLRSMNASFTHCIPSCHKVIEYVMYLSDPTEFRRKYYADRKVDNLIYYNELSGYIGALSEKYLKIL